MIPRDMRVTTGTVARIVLSSRGFRKYPGFPEAKGVGCVMPDSTLRGTAALRMHHLPVVIFRHYLHIEMALDFFKAMLVRWRVPNYQSASN